MKLTIFNGSPKPKNSNSAHIIQGFIRGCEQVEKCESKIHSIRKLKKQDELLSIVKKAENILVVFPLYADAMPGMVKQFFEWLEPLLGKKNNPPISFIIHSGFPESIHCEVLKEYCEIFGKKFSNKYYGTVIHAGSEAYQMMPEKGIIGKLKIIEELAISYVKDGKFSDELLKKSEKPYKYGPITIVILKMLSKIKLVSFYWIMLLRRNKALKNSHDRPYAK